jgi:hypothetical protein
MLNLKSIVAAVLTIIALCTLTSSQALATAVPSKAQFIAQADMYCRAIEPKIRVVARRLDHESVTEAPKTIDAAADIEAHALTHLRAMPEPAGDHAVLSKVWNSYGSLITYTRNLAQDIRAKDVARIRHDTGASTIAQARWKGLAQGYGFRYCGAGQHSG